MKRISSSAFCLLLTATASAHFPWLHITDESVPRLHFGESLTDREYHLPDTIASAEVWQDAIDAPAKKLTMEPIEEEGFTGLEGEDGIEPRGVVRTSVEYGLYHGSKLVYHAQHFPTENPEAWPPKTGVTEGMSATLTVENGELAVRVMFRGEPLSDAGATLSNDSDEENASAQSDDQGVVRFPIEKVKDGLNGIMMMHVDADGAGEVDGKPHESTTSILTATFYYSSEAATRVSALPPVPEAVASFGAAVADEWLYVYGGHIGQAHDHSRENLSGAFRRIRLSGGDWEDLPSGPPLQGLPLVAHGGKLYRIGGLDARNPTGEDEDLHSVAQFACFDPATNEWTQFPPLPAPRSSHDAVVLDGTLYVIGGWALSGDSEGDWQTGALAYDLTTPNSEWKPLAEPPFKRRALAVGHVDGQIAILCGMTDDANLSKQVFFYDPKDQTWSEGPEFPGNAFHGFGLSAWNLGGKLYAGGMEGVLYRLSDDRAGWKKVDEFQTKRFFHQLVPDSQGGLLAVAGASPEVGHTNSIERLDLVFAAPRSDEEAQTSNMTSDFDKTNH